VALVLVLDDDPTTVPAVRAALIGLGMVRVEAAGSRSALITAVRDGVADGVMVAVGGTDPTAALAIVDELVAIDPDLAALALVRDADASGHGAALARLGPLATATTPIRPAELAPRLLALLERRALRRDARTLRAGLEHRERALAQSERSAASAAEALRATHGELEVATARLVEAEKLAAVGRVVTGIAHELSQHLALVGYAEAIKSKVADDPEVAELADVIVSAQKRLAAMVDEIRHFADPAARGEMAREPADLAMVVDEALHLLAYDRDARRRVMVRKWRSRPLVALDAGRFTQVVLNLVSNAVLATEPGSEIEVAIDADERGALLSVADRGAGMPPDVLARLGQPFFTTRGDRGSGLGVGICMRIVEDHGGSLTFASRVGEGTTARVVLPLLEGGAA
jgi:signal transduction histidine kinase